MGRLENRIAVVTGASKGIGKGIARALGEQGACVYLTGRSSGTGDRTIEATARLVEEAGGRAHPFQCDYADDAQIARLFEQIGKQAGRVDILVNNVYTVPNPPA